MQSIEKQPTKEIEAGSIEKFFEKVKELPERPLGDGSCQLIQKKSGEHVVAVCVGSCEHGACFTRMKVDSDDRIRVWCECM